VIISIGISDAAGCWAPKGIAIAVEQTTGRQSLNIHGAINLGQTQMLEVAKVKSLPESTHRLDLYLRRRLPKGWQGRGVDPSRLQYRSHSEARLRRPAPQGRRVCPAQASTRHT
jgi:hypothetical protein